MDDKTKAFVEACEQRATECNARASKATEGPWFLAYRCVHSKPVSDESMRLEELIPAHADDAHPAMIAWHNAQESDVCAVPAAGGDTPTVQGVKDGDFIAHARTDVPTLSTDTLELARIIRNQAQALGMAKELIAQLNKRIDDARRATDEADADEFEEGYAVGFARIRDALKGAK